MENSPRCACVLDFDGVLAKDGKPISGALERVRLLQKHKIPFVVVTNGGGDTEQKQAEHFSAILNNSSSNASGDLSIQFSGEQVILSHTPILQLMAENSDRILNSPGKVMIVGRDKEKNFSIFQNYGFPVEKLVWYEDFIETHEYLTPYLQRERFFARQKMGGSEKAHGLQLKTFNNEILNELEQNPENSQISNIFVIETPKDWQHTIQVLSDVLSSENGCFWRNRFYNPTIVAEFAANKSLQHKQIPIFFSNPDLVYGGSFYVPRFTQGAFRECLELCYSRMNENLKLVFTNYGKPSMETYDFVKFCLKKIGNRENFEKIYCIGDNPKSDILGANQQGEPFFSILVKTGCFPKEKDNDEEIPAKLVKNNICEAVDWILATENLN